MAEDFEELEETFTDNLDETDSGKKSGKAILRRKFDPTNEEDSNLLLLWKLVLTLKIELNIIMKTKNI